MARYGALIAWAGVLGKKDVVALLQANLDQEKKADALLTQLLALRENLVPRTEIFRLEESSTDILVTDAVAGRVLRAGCTGWNSPIRRTGRAASGSSATAPPRASLSGGSGFSTRNRPACSPAARSCGESPHSPSSTCCPHFLLP